MTSLPSQRTSSPICRHWITCEWPRIFVFGLSVARPRTSEKLCGLPMPFATPLRAEPKASTLGIFTYQVTGVYANGGWDTLVFTTSFNATRGSGSVSQLNVLCKHFSSAGNQQSHGGACRENHKVYRFIATKEWCSPVVVCL